MTGDMTNDKNTQNQRRNAAANRQWATRLMKAPDDPMTIRLYALRDGLCSMADRGQVKLEVVTAIFEYARSPEVRECFKSAIVAKQ
jgi:hypothetical protein